MISPENKGRYPHVLAQVDAILHPNKGKPESVEVTRPPIILFNYSRFRERWDSLSVAEQYFSKALIARASAAGILVAATVLSMVGVQESVWGLVPGMAGWAAGLYYLGKCSQAGRR